MQETNKPNFYGRRKGRRVRKAKTSLLESFLPKIKVQEINQNMFGITPEKIYLEIGFGDGQHLAGQALNNPDIGFIGAEVFQNGVANLLSLITGIKEVRDLASPLAGEEELPRTCSRLATLVRGTGGNKECNPISLLPNRVDNIRIWDDDIRPLFSQIPDNFLDKVFLLFPDPWPKKRHAFRRFINSDNLNEITRILKKGGILRVATDHKVYKSWTLRQMHQRQDFLWTAKCSNDWRFEPKDWVKTKYQAKALREGRNPVFLDYEKI